MLADALVRIREPVTKTILRKKHILTIPRDLVDRTPTWQARIAEAEADLGQGNSTVYRSDEEFLASLGD